ncbi:tyrosine recombinase XerD [Paraliobacillus ryukyuensis]|uniref:Integrase/recombinase XerC/integrase/recombinase XerD n=1 Tax=Paraliobacillus ryukyuensis TaxID=200904 RepID=A0A366E715_9BACI|nr:tyrosine-type recombinase/integrase [Paraliobacillus ryukyuensis]RBO97208.1 integrase/recombinase XerC/integrase/recombinase XerD [Paraliobacillus ryukyuensis]
MLDTYQEEGLRGKSKQTIKTYLFCLSKFGKWLDGAGTDLEEYSRTDVQQYIDYLISKRYSATTINKHWSSIKHFSRWANRENAIEDISVISPPNLMNQAPKALSRNDVNKLIREIDRSGNSRNMAIAQTLINTGIRLNELVNLDRNDLFISERKGTLTVRYGKGNKERQLPLSSETRRAISKYLETRQDFNEAMFLSNRNKRVSERTVQHIFEKYKINAHSLRHTFITKLVRNGEDFSLVQSLSGHSNADMVMRYSAPNEEDKEEAVSKLWLSE